MRDRDRERLARYARERRSELGLTQEEVASQGGPSTATLRLIENAAAASYRAKSLRQLEVGLRWAPGSVRSLFAGGEPQSMELGQILPAAPVQWPASRSPNSRVRPHYEDPQVDEYAAYLSTQGDGDIYLSPDEIRGWCAALAARLHLNPTEQRSLSA